MLPCRSVLLFELFHIHFEHIVTPEDVIRTRRSTFPRGFRGCELPVGPTYALAPDEWLLSYKEENSRRRAVAARNRSGSASTESDDFIVGYVSDQGSSLRVAADVLRSRQHLPSASTATTVHGSQRDAEGSSQPAPASGSSNPELCDPLPALTPASLTQPHQ
jgi:hypothetical protein